MVRSDILGILKGAMQKGEEVNNVAQSLVNAGYPPVEVQAAVSHINSSGIIGSLSSASPAQSLQQLQSQPKMANASQASVLPTLQAQPLPSLKQKTPGKSKSKMIILIVLLVVLILALAGTIIFKDSIFSLFS